MWFIVIFPVLFLTVATLIGAALVTLENPRPRSPASAPARRGFDMPVVLATHRFARRLLSERRRPQPHTFVMEDCQPPDQRGA
jgi:hypothetical protein